MTLGTCPSANTPCGANEHGWRGHPLRPQHLCSFLAWWAPVAPLWHGSCSSKLAPVKWACRTIDVMEIFLASTQKYIWDTHLIPTLLISESHKFSLPVKKLESAATGYYFIYYCVSTTIIITCFFLEY